MLSLRIQACHAAGHQKTTHLILKSKMKIAKRLLSCGLGISMIAGLSSCGSDNREFFSFQSFSLSTVAEGSDNDSVKDDIPSFDGRWDVQVKGIQPVKIGPNELTALNDTLGSLSCVDFTAAPAVLKLPSELTAITQQGNDSIAPKSKLMKTITLDLLNTRVSVFRVHTFSYPEGAAHGLYSNLYVNYDIEKGVVLSLANLFIPGFERSLQPEILERLKAAQSQLLSEDDEIGVSPNFRITGEGVEFVYGLYTIAPYSEGEPTVTFKPYELTEILSADGKRVLGID